MEFPNVQQLAIVGIIALEGLALCLHIDGVYLSAVIAVLGPIAGYKIGLGAREKANGQE
jgi:hypothetical protein